MTNSIEFILKLKNLMGGELTRVGSAAQSTFSQMRNHVDQVTNRNRALGMSYTEIQRQIQQAESTLRSSTIPSQLAFARRELQSLQRQASRHPGAMTEGGSSSATTGRGMGINGVAIGSMLGGIYTRGLSMITAGAGSIIQAAFEKENSIAGLTTFLGADGAKDAYKNILADSEATPFDTNSLLMVNRSLISAGVNANSARETSLDLANAVSAVGGGNAELSRMAANMQQIKTVGKATAMDIKQFGMAGINIYEMLARSTGKNIDQVKEMEVTYEQLQKALAMSRGKGGMYEGALELASQTDEARLNTMREKFVNAGVLIYQAFKPVISVMLDWGVKIANYVAPAIMQLQPYIEMISTKFLEIVDFVSNLTNATGGWADYLAIAQNYIGIVWNFIKNIAVKVWNMVAGIIEFIKNSEIIKDIFRFVGWIMEKVFAIINALADTLLWLWENVISPVIEALDKAYKWVKDFFSGDEKEIVVKVSKKSTANTVKPKATVFDDFAQTTNANTTAATTAGETVVGGGPKTINIHVSKFFDTIQFTTMDGQESAEQLEKIVLEQLARVIYNGSKLT